MDKQQFWILVEEARAHVPDGGDAAAIAGRASALLAVRPAQEIVSAQQVLWDLMADSYRAPLWAAAYVINGGCSDDAFEYFRGWLITRGRSTFERIVAATDALAELPEVRAAATGGSDLECEEALHIVWDAHVTATGEQLPTDAFRIRYPALDPEWDFDFDDRSEVSRRLPALAALYADR
jgi:hypothetical protein